MNSLGNVLAGIAALGAGFGAGVFQKSRLTVGDPGDASALAPSAVTFVGGARKNGGTVSDRPHPFGLIPFTTFAEAEPRVEELLENYGKPSAWRSRKPIDAERILDEIEQILALATEEELVDFIGELDFGPGLGSGHHNDDIAKIAFGVLADVSPSRAAEIGLENWIGSDSREYSGLGSLVRVWEQRDATACESWIRKLDDKSLRITARSMLLTIRATSDPAAMFVTYADLDLNAEQSVTAALGKSLEVEQLPELADQFMEKLADGSAHSESIPLLVQIWGSRDPEGMLDWLVEQDSDIFDDNTVRNSLYQLAASDPARVLEKLTPELSEKENFVLAAGRAWWSLLLSDEGAGTAVRWLGENMEHATAFGEWRIADFATSASDWTPERAARVLDALVALPDSDAKDTFAQGFFERLSRYQPETVLPYALEYLPLGSQSVQTIARTVGSWAQEDPEAAIRWSLEHLKSHSAQSEAIRFSFGRWAERDGQAAAEFALTLPEEQRERALSGIDYSWARSDPDGLLSYMRGVSDPAELGTLARSSFFHLANDRSAAKYFPKALGMPPGKLRHDAVNGIFRGWALAEPHAAVGAIDQVPEGSLRNAAIRGFNEFAIREHPELALDMAARISVPKGRDRELIARGRAWMKKDPGAAEAAILGSAAISDRVKAEIFK